MVSVKNLINAVYLTSIVAVLFDKAIIRVLLGKPVDCSPAVILVLVSNSPLFCVTRGVVKGQLDILSCGISYTAYPPLATVLYYRCIITLSCSSFTAGRLVSLIPYMSR
ncbi:hypothetical protein J6590_048388 [Homalodisca vitripennis]|nr:hypothetical protein J6590_048388 [Homalodisca vitripennis]